MNVLLGARTAAFLRGHQFCAAANCRDTRKEVALVLAASALFATAVFIEYAAPVAADTHASGDLSAEELKAAVDVGAFTIA